MAQVGDSERSVSLGNGVSEADTFILRLGKKELKLRERTHLMGILNVTPDSFSDGGCFMEPDRALAHAQKMTEEGADIIDVGGESTRPGSLPVSPEEELRRILPVISRITKALPIPISIDTTKAVVAREALEAGAELINDVSALRFDPDMLATAVHYGVPVILMHMRGTTKTMQANVDYDDLMMEIAEFLKERIEVAESAGVEPHRIIIDPGIGFGKPVCEGNLSVLKHLGRVACLNKPILVGPSRKAFIGKILGKEASQRDEGTATACAIAIYNGAHIVRTHNVGKIKEVARMADAIRRAE
jgi:dihydropteroate synthase